MPVVVVAAALATTTTALLFAVEAVKSVASTEPDAVAEAMRTLEYDGVCATADT